MFCKALYVQADSTAPKYKVSKNYSRCSKGVDGPT